MRILARTEHSSRQSLCGSQETHEMCHHYRQKIYIAVEPRPVIVWMAMGSRLGRRCKAHNTCDRTRVERPCEKQHELHHAGQMRRESGSNSEEKTSEALLVSLWRLSLWLPVQQLLNRSEKKQDRFQQRKIQRHCWSACSL